MLTKQNEVLFDTTGQRDDGTFMLKLHTTESDQISIEEGGAIFLVLCLVEVKQLMLKEMHLVREDCIILK